MPECRHGQHCDHRLSLEDLKAQGLLDAPALRAFDSLTRLALRLFDVPVALVSLVAENDDCQYFASVQGLPEPWQSRRETPLSHSFCKTVKDTGQALAVTDARADPAFCAHPAVPDLGVVGYLGVPIHAADGMPLGAICVISDAPRDWTDADTALLTDLARCVNDEILLRATLVRNRALTSHIESTFDKARHDTALRESVMWAFMAPDLPTAERIPALLRATCRALDFDAGQIVRVREDYAEMLFTDRGPSTVALPRRIPLEGSLAALVLRGGRILQLSDVPDMLGRGRFDMNGSVPQSYVGVPISVEDEVFGLLELTADTPRAGACADADLSVVTIVSMIASVCLGFIDQIRTLEKSEAHLIACLGADATAGAVRKFA